MNYINKYFENKEIGDDGTLAKLWRQIIQLNNGRIGKKNPIKRKIQNKILRQNIKGYCNKVTSYKELKDMASNIHIYVYIYYYLYGENICCKLNCYKPILGLKNKQKKNGVGTFKSFFKSIKNPFQIKFVDTCSSTEYIFFFILNRQYVLFKIKSVKKI